MVLTNGDGIHIRHHVEDQQIGLEGDDAVVLGQSRQLRLPHIDHREVVVLFGHIHDTVGDNRMRLHRIGADDDHIFALVDIIIGVGRCPPRLWWHASP